MKWQLVPSTPPLALRDVLSDCALRLDAINRFFCHVVTVLALTAGSPCWSTLYKQAALLLFDRDKTHLASGPSTASSALPTPATSALTK
jgi:hypothetical protein